MENLANIPLREDVQLTDNESAVLREYFGDGSGQETRTTSLSWTDSLRVSGYGVLLFAVLANPWINALIYKIPYVSNNPVIAFCMKLFIFLFAMFLLAKFAV